MMSDAEVITILICFHFNTYRNFVAERPDALRRLSVKVVAQYLHMALETLSRIRARIVRRKMQ